MRPVILLLIALISLSCNQQKKSFSFDDPEILHRNEKNLTYLIIYDIFSPPVASRIYAYTSLAAHEALRHIDVNEPSIVSKLKGFGEMPQPQKGKQYNFPLAACKAFYIVAGNITFSTDSVKKIEENTYAPFKNKLSKDVFENSLSFGESVGNAIMKRVRDDHYKQTRGMDKYLGNEGEGKWKPTAPDYLDGIEPYWYMIHSLTMDSSNQFDPGPPPAFEKKKNSMFYQMNQEVYQTGKILTQEQKDIAYFWDDNPFASRNSGHMLFNIKKQTPGGHWMGITAIACRKSNAPILKTARAYAMTAVGLMDGFISCWTTKYHYKYVRPITIINEWIDNNWDSYLQTPAFPEYTSAHSTVTGTAATILTDLFGDNFSFHDDADKEFIGMERDFTSFLAAAQEASISRLYGGIHYRLSLERGVETGIKLGKHILQTVKME